MHIRQWLALTASHLRMTLRDRILHAIFGVAVVMLLLVPSLSSFSMRQVQELAITLSLSSISLCLLIIALLLGSSSVWRDIERRYTASILTLPISRGNYLLAKFASISISLLVCGIILGMAATVVISFAAASYPSDLPIAWGTLLTAIVFDVLKYIVLTAVAILLSAVSTSMFLPFFGTFAIYLAGSASQEVYEYVSAEFGHEIHPLSVGIIKGVYYLLPNFSAFNFKVHAVYALPISAPELYFPFIYSLIYTCILLGLAIWAFNRRELP
jgi:ABC-type transport system involved in multi-copper enzyme maturation permease subunit